MKQRLFHFTVIITFVIIAAFAGRSFLHNHSQKVVAIKSLNSWQNADIPLGYPINDTEPVFDSRFIQLNAFERATIPTITQMNAAMGTEQGALTYDAQPFWSDNSKRGGHHSGDDLNGIGGQNSDLGDPVYAVGCGLVIYRGEPSPGWGNTLTLAHRTPKGNILLSMYAHLQKINAAYGDLLPRGNVLGEVGTANNRYLAHLHLEMLESSGVHIGRGYASHPGERISPTKTIAKHQSSSPQQLCPPPLDIVITERHDKLLENISIQSEQ